MLTALLTLSSCTPENPSTGSETASDGQGHRNESTLISISPGILVQNDARGVPSIEVELAGSDGKRQSITLSADEAKNLRLGLVTGGQTPGPDGTVME